jgi:hypothetical protein
LACELAAYFYLELGEISNSIEYFLLAHERYHEWVSSKVGFFLMCCVVLYNQLLIIYIWSTFVDLLTSKGAFGKCNSLFKFVEGIMKERVGPSPTIAHDVDSVPASSLRQKGLQIAAELRKRRAADSSSRL